MRTIEQLSTRVRCRRCRATVRMVRDRAVWPAIGERVGWRLWLRLTFHDLAVSKWRCPGCERRREELPPGPCLIIERLEDILEPLR